MQQQVPVSSQQARATRAVDSRQARREEFNINHQGPTWHTVFGPEIVQNGRVSIVTDVADGRGSEWRRRNWYSPVLGGGGSGG